MHRRLACLAVALLVSGCSLPGLSSPPNYQYVVITAGGVGLRTGASDVPSNLDLRLHATAPPLQTARVPAPVKPMALSSSHRLAVAVAGLSTQHIPFPVIPATAAMLAARVDPSIGL